MCPTERLALLVDRSTVPYWEQVHANWHKHFSCFSVFMIYILKYLLEEGQITWEEIDELVQGCFATGFDGLLVTFPLVVLGQFTLERVQKGYWMVRNKKKSWFKRLKYYLDGDHLFIHPWFDQTQERMTQTDVHLSLNQVGRELLAYLVDGSALQHEASIQTKYTNESSPGRGSTA